MLIRAPKLVIWDWQGTLCSFDGVPLVFAGDLVALFARHKILQAVASNAETKLIYTLCKRFGWNFSLVVGADSGVPLKPNPHMVAKILSDLNCKPEETLLLGDSMNDMRAAQQAGTFCYHVGGGLKVVFEYYSHILEGKPH